MAEQILKVEYSDIMQKSYIDYSMSVITDRAVPDIRDGLKPVQRRVLYDMNQLGVHHDSDTLKSARICGDTMGKYHPHGDASIYETMVVLAQDFKRNCPLVIGQGNFGSIEGDGAAAQRYTEAKLAKITDEVFLKDLDKSVDFVPNYDEKLKEPVVLPARIPNFLLNGSEGIAVGMATSVPSHNLGEICDLIVAYVKNPSMNVKQMMKYLKGPDFPTGGIIANMSELKSIYETGTGKLKLRGKIEFEPAKKASGKDKLVVTEIPYTMVGNIRGFMAEVQALCEDKKILDITDMYNHSNEEGVRLVMELKKGANVEKLINLLYKKTKLENTFGVNMLAIVEGRPETMTLKSIMANYVKFQYELIQRKYKNLLDTEEERKEIQEGLIAAVDVIDAIIAMLRASKTRADAKACLKTGDVKDIKIKDKALVKIVKKFSFTDKQAEAILSMPLYRLIGLELNALLEDNKQTLAKIKEYKAILKSKDKADELIIEDVTKIKKEYARPRRTTFEDAEEIVIEEEPVQEIEVYYLQDKFGYCKLIDTATYERNKETVETEFKYVIKTTNLDKIALFTAKGMMYQIKLEQVPLCKIRDKGTPVDNLSKFSSSDDEILYVTSAKLPKGYILFASKEGLVKLVETAEYETNQKAVAATKLNDGDSLVSVLLCTGKEDIILQTKDNYFLRYDMSEVSVLKKNTKGIKGINIGDEDSLKAAYAFPKKDNGATAPLGGEKFVRLSEIPYGTRATKGKKQK